jgi:hypothetical protein
MTTTDRISDCVLRKLSANTDAASASALWERIWAAYEEGGTDAVETMFDTLIEEAESDDRH